METVDSSQDDNKNLTFIIFNVKKEFWSFEEELLFGCQKQLDFYQSEFWSVLKHFSLVTFLLNF